MVQLNSRYQVFKLHKKSLDQYPTLPVGVERPGARLSTTDEGELVIEGKV